MKIRNYLLLLGCTLLLSIKGNSQSLRGMYINKFDEIIGNQVKEDSLLTYFQDSSFNYLALYDLSSLDYTSTAEMNMLSAFILKARQDYGIPYIGAVGETYAFFNDIKGYNNSRSSANEKFNVFNLEFEFWITSSTGPGGYYCVKYLQPAGCDCDTAGAFAFYINLLNKMDSLADTQGAISETYIGWFNQGQGKQIQSSVDRILLHAYRVDNSSVWGYSKTRLGYLASNNQMVNVAPIFSSEPIFMGPWLQNHSQLEAYNKYEADFNADNASWKPYVNLVGYQWFCYGFMPKPAPGNGAAPTITANGTTTFCPGESVTLTSSQGTGYLWSNGATTQSITVSASGNYSCAVTYGANTNTSNTISVSVYSPPAVTIIVNAPVNNTVPLSSNATAGSGSISAYQWKRDNGNIAGATANVYTATSSGDYSLLVTNSNGCSSVSATEAVSIITSCTPEVPQGVYTGAITPTTAVVHWTPPANADSIIIRYQTETTQEISYIKIKNTGQSSFQLTNLVDETEYSWRAKTSCAGTWGIYSDSQYFTTTPLTAVSENNSSTGNQVVIHPNPASNQLSIMINSNSTQPSQLIISDLAGKVIYADARQLVTGKNVLTTNVSAFASGIYFLAIKTESGITTQRISLE